MGMRSYVRQATIITTSTVAIRESLPIAENIESLEEEEKRISISRTNKSFEVARENFFLHEEKYSRH